MEIRNDMQLFAAVRSCLSGFRIELQYFVDNFAQGIRIDTELAFDLVVMLLCEFVQIILNDIHRLRNDGVVLIFFAELYQQAFLQITRTDTWRIKLLDD